MASGLPSTPHTIMSERFFTSSFSLLAYHNGIKLMLVPVSKQMLVGSRSFVLKLAGSLAPNSKPYDGVKSGSAEAFILVYSDKWI